MTRLAPQPGAQLASLIQMLADTITEIDNSTVVAVDSMLSWYKSWSTMVIQKLSSQLSPIDVEALIASRRHWLLMELQPAYPPGRDVPDMVRAELAYLRKALVAEREHLQELYTYWDHHPASHVFSMDTNAYLHRPRPFYEEDWLAYFQGIFGGGAVFAVHLLIPMQVIRELDRHKRTQKNITVGDTAEPLRTRARVTIRKITEMFADDTNAKVDLAPNVRTELILDSLDHKRLDDADSEIIDRLVAAKGYINQQIDFLAVDATSRFIAQDAGLNALSSEP